MPELPDVEGFKRVLAKNALRKTIDRVAVNDARILGKLPARTFISRLQDAKLVAARRHGKHLMAKIDRGGWLTLHFGMTGALQFVRNGDDEPPFTRVRLDFAGDGCLAYTNKRMIGRVGLVEDAADFIAAEELGPDALDRRFDLDAFKAAVLGIKRDVKSVLMDQTDHRRYREYLFRRDPVSGAHQSSRADPQSAPGRAQAPVCENARGPQHGDCPGRRLGAVHRANAQGFASARAQERRALPALSIAPEGLQDRRPHRLLLPPVPRLLTLQAGKAWMAGT